MKSDIIILMSTYNGAHYLNEQLLSIYSQKNVHLDLLVRDDGSKDETLSILQNEQNKGKLNYYTGGNLGPANSFLDLLFSAPQHKYYAFSDQDDVWLDDKLDSAIKQIEKYDDVPALYFCQTQLVDKNLNKMENVTIHPYLSYGESLVYQFVGGCTMVFNDALRKIIVNYHPDFLMMHDTWIYSIALAVNAKIVFDPEAHILYRQHGHNAVGQTKSKMYEWKKRIHRLMDNKHIRSRIAKELEKGFLQQMSDENQKLTVWAANYRNDIQSKYHLLFSSKYKCANTTTFILSKLSIFLNLF